MALARRELMLGVHRFRLRREDLEDCYSQATLELFRRGEVGAGVCESPAHRECHRAEVSLEGSRSPARDLRTEPDAGGNGGRRRAGRRGDDDRDRGSPLGTGQGRDPASGIGAPSGNALQLTPDQRLVLASQVALGIGCDEFCRLHGWSPEKYRKVAQRGRARLRRLMSVEDAVPSPTRRVGSGDRDQPVTSSPPTHRLVSRCAGDRSDSRPPGATDPRDGGRHPGCDVTLVSAARAKRSARRMRWPRRAPREVYRVFDEQDFLDTEPLDELRATEEPAGALSRRASLDPRRVTSSPPSSARRIAGHLSGARPARGRCGGSRRGRRGIDPHAGAPARERDGRGRPLARTAPDASARGRTRRAERRGPARRRQPSGSPEQCTPTRWPRHRSSTVCGCGSPMERASRPAQESPASRRIGASSASRGWRRRERSCARVDDAPTRSGVCACSAACPAISCSRVAGFGIAASARFAIAPPRPVRAVGAGWSQAPRGPGGRGVRRGVRAALPELDSGNARSAIAAGASTEGRLGTRGGRSRGGGAACRSGRKSFRPANP